MGSSVYLVGFMRTGKSTIGRLLATELGWPFVDLDDLVSERAGRPVAAIFQDDGEAVFRRLESEALATVAGLRLVIATGGGTFASGANPELMLASGLVLWLRLPFGVIWNRAIFDTSVMRPLWTDRESLGALHEARDRAYARAHDILDVERLRPAAAAQALAARVRDWDGRR